MTQSQNINNPENFDNEYTEVRLCGIKSNGTYKDL